MEPGGLLVPRRRYLRRRGAVLPVRVVRRKPRPKSPSRAAPRDVRRHVSFAEGEDDSIPLVSDESDVDGPDHTSGPHADTAGAARSSGRGRAPELRSELFDSLQRVDDPLMQPLGSFLSASVAETLSTGILVFSSRLHD